MLHEAKEHLDKAKRIMKIAFGNDRTEATKKLMLVDDFINGHQPQFCEIDGAYIEFIVFIKKIYYFFFLSENDCCICFESMDETSETSKLRCSHEYHAECFKEWSKYKKGCPICLGESL